MGSSASWPSRPRSLRRPPSGPAPGCRTRRAAWCPPRRGARRAGGRPGRSAGRSSRRRRSSAHRLRLAAMGEGEQVVLVEAGKRALQQARQVEVVVGEQHEAAQRDQVHDRDLLAQHHPVDAGHGDAAAFQRADQLLDEARAPAHEDQDVLRAHRPALGREDLAAAGACRRCAWRSPGPGGAAGESLSTRSTGGRQGSGSSSGLARSGAQTSTSPPSPARLAATSWRIGAPSRATPSRASSSLNTASTAASTALVERKETVRSTRSQRCFAAADSALEALAVAQEQARVGALEAEDRLLDVADREDGAGGRRRGHGR